jgi:DNA repair exonuclease SbcCD ATPase subunit
MAQEVMPECQAGFTDLRISLAAATKDIEQQTKVTDKLSEAVEKIQEMNANLCKLIALHELKHDTTEKALAAAEDDMKEEIKEVHGRIDRLTEKPRSGIIPAEKPETELEEQMQAALKEITMWKYIIVGAAAVIGYLLAHVNWAILLQLIQFKGQ